MNIRYYTWLATILLVLFGHLIVVASDLRLQSLGNTRLSLPDQDNNLNLFDFIHNPAYLLEDGQENWLKFWGGGNYNNTSLKRQYDPDMEQNILFNFAGYKKLSSNQAVLGRINYNFNSRYHVDYALEREPYADDPALLTDTTSGNFFTDGPSVEVLYNIQPFSRLGLGAGVLYQISTGLKKQYTRSRTIHRNFEATVAMTYKIRHNLFAGAFLHASFLQDQIELTKSWDEKAIFTLRYRSELVYRGVVDEFDRYINQDGLHYNAALQYDAFDNRFQNILSFDYFDNKQEISDESGTRRYMELYWYQNIARISYYGRYILGTWVLGGSFSYTDFEDWSEHPSLPILITERTRSVLEAGLGISRRLGQFLVALEGGYRDSEIDYTDYQSLLKRSGTQNNVIGKVGLEWNLDPIHQLRLGYNYDNFRPDYLSPRYLPENKAHYMSFGLAENRLQYEIELHFDYAFREAADSPSNYNGWNFLIFTRIYMF